MDWTFARDEIAISDIVIGRGAFGEVRVATWRNTAVACKVLHTTDDATDSLTILDGKEVKQEIEMLSKLRHPNLVLFLGVCREVIDGNTIILTELLPCSLYDILEERKMHLDLADILDISLDIAFGLNYLHMHSPCIVHRDISSKNILLGGGRAKIADLGQAKIFNNSVLSRQTGMPGAMAYSAPEVLTGKYSAKIDIFSFGVLLCQMCCREYPRIDKRETQLDAAAATFPPFRPLLTTMVKYAPAERPDAALICETLQSIKNNDRYYDVQRKSEQFEKDVGVLSRQWANRISEEKCREVKLALDQTSRRLAAEEIRWRTEAGKVDGLTNNLKSAEERMKEAVLKLEQKMIEHSLTLGDLHSARQEIDSLNNKLISSTSTLTKQTVALQEAEMRLIQKSFDFDEATSTIKNLNEANAETLQKLEHSKINESEYSNKVKQLTAQLNGQVQFSRDLESRLEQALTRWKQEHMQKSSESARCARLASQNGDLIDRADRLSAEAAKYEQRLQQYDDLPLPDEIKLRFSDLQSDLQHSHDDIKALTAQKQEFQDELFKTTEQLREMESFNEQLTDKLAQRELSLDNLNLSLKNKDAEIVLLQQELGTREDMLMKLTIESRRLTDNDNTLSKVLNDMQTALAKEKQTVAALRRSLQQHQQQMQSDGIDDDGGDGGDGVGNGFDESPIELVEGDHVGSGEEGSTHLIIAAENQSPLRSPSLAAGTTAGATRRATTSRPRSESTDRANSRGGSGGDNNSSGKGSAASSLLSRIQDFEQRALIRDRNQRDAAVDRKPELTIKLEVQSIASSDGAALQLVEYIRDNQHDERAVWRACRALREAVAIANTTNDSPSVAVAANTDATSASVRPMLIAAKFEVLLLQCMNRFMDVAEVLVSSIRLLGTLAFGSDLFRRKAGEKDALVIIVTGMHMHPQDETLNVHACTAITNFTHNSLENRSRFIEAHGVSVLVNCMHLHIDSAKVQRQACWAMLTLCGSDEAATEISASNGEISVISAMTRHKYDSGVQQFGCWALRNLSLSSGEIAIKIKSQGAVELCRMAIETHGEDIEVLKQARNLLGVLSPLQGSTTTASSFSLSANTSPYAPQHQLLRNGNDPLHHSASSESLVALPTITATSSAKMAMSKKLRAQIIQQQHA